VTFLDVVKLAGTILFSLGGGGAIVLGLSRFLGRVWADRALEDHRQRYNELNLRLQHTLENASKRLQMELDTVGLVHRLRTREEFTRLAALWKKLAHLEFTLGAISGPREDLGPTYEAGWRKYRGKLIENFETAVHNTQDFFYEEMIFIPEPIAMKAELALSSPLRVLDYLDSVQDSPLDSVELRKLVQRARDEFGLSLKDLEQLIRVYIRAESPGKLERPYDVSG
jgi:hypothetical protein